MSQPVWTLSVDLQAKTATFTSGLADAAKSARGSFNEIKEGAKEAGESTGFSMREARESTMLLGEEFGVHIPRALTSFIAGLGPVGGALEAAFPFLAIVVGATLLLEHLSKMKEETEKLTETEVSFGTATNNVLNGLNDKLLQAGIRADDLNHNHLGVLEKELQLIDHASMSELVQTFGTVSKAADLTFTELKTHWYQFGSGSEGAKHAMDQFKTEYESLLAQGKSEEANNLLTGTLKAAQQVLVLQKQAKDNTYDVQSGQNNTDYNKFEEAKNALKAQGVGYTEKEITAQETLVDALRAQVSVQDKVDELKKAQSTNAKTGTGNQINADADKVFREQAASLRQAEDQEDKDREQRRQEAIANVQQGEKEKIDATRQGSATRLAAIDASIKEENALGLQETSFYRSLLTARIQLLTQMSEEEKRLNSEAAREGAAHTAKMSELDLAARHEQHELSISTLRNSQQAQLAEAIHFANEDMSIKQQQYAKDIAALDKDGKEYGSKLKAIQDRQAELVKEHENKVTQIKTKAEEERNTRILSAERRMDDEIARGLSSVLMRHQSFASMMGSLADQIGEGMIQNALKSILADDMTKPHDAAKAARKMYLAGMEFPFPANIVMGPALGAMAFASVMAFETGGLVPGVATGDVVPAMLMPGEAVIPKKLMDRIMREPSDGGSGAPIHIHHHQTNHIHAIDGASVRGMLENNSEIFAQHVNNHLRKMNR